MNPFVLDRLPESNYALSEVFPYLQSYVIAGLRLTLHHYHLLGVTTPTHRVGQHQHKWWEITRVVAGQVEYTQSDSLGVYGRNDWFVMPPGIPHSWRVTQTPAILSGFQLWIEGVTPQAKELLADYQNFVFKGRHRFEASAEAARLEESCWRELASDAPLLLAAAKVNHLVGAYLTALFEISLRPLLIHSRRRRLTALPGGRERNLVASVIDFIEANLGKPIQIEDILSHVHFSSRQLNRYFQKETGRSVARFILEKKLAEAKKQLTYSERQVKDIAFSLGFVDIGYFCRFFRHQTEMTPMDYRSRTRLQVR